MTLLRHEVHGIKIKVATGSDISSSSVALLLSVEVSLALLLEGSLKLYCPDSEAGI